jgi:hypothetical protein
LKRENIPVHQIGKFEFADKIGECLVEVVRSF